MEEVNVFYIIWTVCGQTFRKLIGVGGGGGEGGYQKNIRPREN